MRIVWGVAVVVLSLLAWGGQTLSWLSPSVAARLGLVEDEADVDPVFWADIRGEALWDAFSLWPMVVAGALLTVDHSAWPYFGLVGGGTFVYFAGRGITVRLVMQRRGHRIGSEQSVRTGLIGLAVWGLMAFVTIAAAVVDLEGG